MDFFIESVKLFYDTATWVYFVPVLIFKIFSLGCIFKHSKWQGLYLFVEESMFVKGNLLLVLSFINVKTKTLESKRWVS